MTPNTAPSELVDESATQPISSATLSQLRGSELLLEVIAQNVAELIAVVDSRGRRIWNNAAYAESLGYSPAELKGSDSMVEIHPDDLGLVRATFYESMREGHGHRIEYRMRRKDGGWIVLESEGRVARNWNGHDRCLVVVSRDITAKKQEEEAKQERMGLQIKRAMALAEFASSQDLQEGELSNCFAKVGKTAVELSRFARVSVWTMDQCGAALSCHRPSSADAMPLGSPTFTILEQPVFFSLLRNENVIAGQSLGKDVRLAEIER